MDEAKIRDTVLIKNFKMKHFNPADSRLAIIGANAHNVDYNNLQMVDINRNESTDFLYGSEDNFIYEDSTFYYKYIDLSSAKNIDIIYPNYIDIEEEKSIIERQKDVVSITEGPNEFNLSDFAPVPIGTHIIFPPGAEYIAYGKNKLTDVQTMLSRIIGLINKRNLEINNILLKEISERLEEIDKLKQEIDYLKKNINNSGGEGGSDEDMATLNELTNRVDELEAQVLEMLQTEFIASKNYQENNGRMTMTLADNVEDGASAGIFSEEGLRINLQNGELKTPNLYVGNDGAYFDGDVYAKSLILYDEANEEFGENIKNKVQEVSDGIIQSAIDKKFEDTNINDIISEEVENKLSEGLDIPKVFYSSTVPDSVKDGDIWFYQGETKDLFDGEKNVQIKKGDILIRKEVNDIGSWVLHRVAEGSILTAENIVGNNTVTEILQSQFSRIGDATKANFSISGNSLVAKDSTGKVYFTVNKDGIFYGEVGDEDSKQVVTKDELPNYPESSEEIIAKTIPTSFDILDEYPAGQRWRFEYEREGQTYFKIYVLNSDRTAWIEQVAQPDEPIKVEVTDEQVRAAIENLGFDFKSGTSVFYGKASEAPANPKEGDLWYEYDDNNNVKEVKRYKDGAWVKQGLGITTLSDGSVAAIVKQVVADETITGMLKADTVTIGPSNGTQFIVDGTQGALIGKKDGTQFFKVTPSGLTFKNNSVEKTMSSVISDIASAQSTANSAQSTANSAQSTANSANVNASNALAAASSVEALNNRVTINSNGITIRPTVTLQTGNPTLQLASNLIKLTIPDSSAGALVLNTTLNAVATTIKNPRFQVTNGTNNAFEINADGSFSASNQVATSNSSCVNKSNSSASLNGSSASRVYFSVTATGTDSCAYAGSMTNKNFTMKLSKFGNVVSAKMNIKASTGTKSVNGGKYLTKGYYKFGDPSFAPATAATLVGHYGGGVLVFYFGESNSSGIGQFNFKNIGDSININTSTPAALAGTWVSRDCLGSPLISDYSEATGGSDYSDD